MLRVSDSAGPHSSLSLALLSVLPSVYRKTVGTLKWDLSQLNTWPIPTPVNASPDGLPQLGHDSGTKRLTPLTLYGILIHTFMPAWPAHLLLILSKKNKKKNPFRLDKIKQ
jgi:hypothetical protein